MILTQKEVLAMDSYTVKQVSQILKTNEETVRRWIRSGKLPATLVSKKGGHTITADSLKEFVKQTPKYAPVLAASLALTPFTMSAVIGSVIGGLLVLAESSKSVTVNDVESFLKKKIDTQGKTLKKKEAQLKKLQEEIEAERQELAKYQFALDNLDLKQIADNINTAKRK